MVKPAPILAVLALGFALGCHKGQRVDTTVPTSAVVPIATTSATTSVNVIMEPGVEVEPLRSARSTRATVSVPIAVEGTALDEDEDAGSAPPSNFGARPSEPLVAPGLENSVQRGTSTMTAESPP